MIHYEKATVKSLQASRRSQLPNQEPSYGLLRPNFPYHTGITCDTHSLKFKQPLCYSVDPLLTGSLQRRLYCTVTRQYPMQDRRFYLSGSISLCSHGFHFGSELSCSFSTSRNLLPRSCSLRYSFFSFLFRPVTAQMSPVTIKNGY